ncbi:hypothetical protein P3X46_023080 [Hevea brasiliensis]|uniref:Uncharacterized protein n=1 Tax=Hevea brasiliensis TaxID=3981 RepID=A0ABQ9L9V5_HEVBR|nr:hypothetical protein P3X46_023080 [Hevea brasiliensis]
MQFEASNIYSASKLCFRVQWHHSRLRSLQLALKPPHLSRKSLPNLAVVHPKLRPPSLPLKRPSRSPASLRRREQEASQQQNEEKNVKNP